MNTSSVKSSPFFSNVSSRSRLKPHFSRTRIEPTLCLATCAWRGRSGRSCTKAARARGARAGLDLLAPVLLSDPIADKALTLLGPAPDVARHRAVDQNRLRERRGVAEDVFRPVRVERCTVARGEGGHARGVGVELVVE